ncbi:MAG: hypothetical protein VYE81_03255 [Planctomycetota bacterium]|nr:hypothetical protein [Planctomycetota bacterium]
MNFWSRFVLGGVAASSLLAACEREVQAEPRWFELLQVRPEQSEGLFLNETLTFDFSHPLDPSSVTAESMRIVDGEGRPAAGVFRVDRRRIRFLPDPVLGAELTDGGLRPGTRYTALIQGFPAPDGLRGRDGRPLARSVSWSFETAHLTDPRGQMFVDHTPLFGLRLHPGEELTTVRDDPRVIVFCEEPVDPSTLRAEDFHFQTPAGERIDLQARLLANHAHLVVRGRRALWTAAEIELVPMAELSPGVHSLRMAPDMGLLDFGGNRVQPYGSAIEVDVQEAAGTHTQDVLRREANTRPVPGADGTAAWGGGRVTVRYPRAAGDGRDGPTDLPDGDLAAKDLHATRLTLPAESTCRLEAPGLVVLRAQGRLSIEGDLLRTVGEARGLVVEEGERLSTWLERAQVEDPPWTVIVAGGDLVVTGRIEVDGPLLLVAGGWIRVAERPRAAENELWILGEGGGLALPSTASTVALELDAPLENPLRTSLTFAVLSDPIPSVGSVARWGRASVSGRENGGAFRVRYVREEDLPLGGSIADWDPQDDPRQVRPPGRLRLLIELTVGPPGPGPGAGRRWSPPVVDGVRLSWPWGEEQAR